MITTSPFSSGDFADHVDDRGRYVRDWRRWSEHRPLVEIRDGPEGFDPPFGSGDVLVKVLDGDIPVYALSEAHYRWSVLQLAREVLQDGGDYCASGR